MPGGFGICGIEGKIQAVRHAREMQIPYFGICLGMQVAVIEYARYVLGHADANSTEFAADTKHPVICLLEDQKTVTHKGATMRLAPRRVSWRRIRWRRVVTAYRRSASGTGIGMNSIRNTATQRIGAGLSLSGLSPDGRLVEIVEIPEHPWFLAV
ncbi:MAG: gamma-glutamyl-gamma-aminobutyrate hydrolase family protein [Planctomycetaceae bacterium]